MSHSTAKPKCPECHQEVVPKTEGQCVACPLCSKAKRRVFHFCWDCQREWPRRTSPTSSCTLSNCAIRAVLLSDKRINDPNSSAKGCPYFRACPMCNALLTHNGIGCRNITCPKCCTHFCFRCLRTRCFLTGLNVRNFTITDRPRLIEIQQCTIVDNSQSLTAFC